MAERAEAAAIRDLAQEHEPQIPVGRSLDVDVSSPIRGALPAPLTLQFPDTDSALGSETSSYAPRTVIVSALLIYYQSDNVN